MKLYYKNYWNDGQIVLGKSSGSEGLIAVGEVLKNGGERFIHIKEKDLIKFLIKSGVIKTSLKDFANKEKKE